MYEVGPRLFPYYSIPSMPISRPGSSSSSISGARTVWHLCNSLFQLGALGNILWSCASQTICKPSKMFCCIPIPRFSSIHHVISISASPCLDRSDTNARDLGGFNRKASILTHVTHPIWVQLSAYYLICTYIQCTHSNCRRWLGSKQRANTVSS
ncbi:hypothetical protein K504DRAFT_224771 [Pleomassaria siparia CBS 279.74]|uniref:Uncharacterized protein n=1 Tax=Pleomassaria siparia CBS 279.74 TaxID=1314801 RepID=A0A6G1KFB7_9PLEO|nr:hypothetical protein K504DRAFT_224771 [Pleomassaria siparia CBS 279.74]